VGANNDNKMNNYTNPNPNFHIDYLIAQLKLIRYIKQRKLNSNVDFMEIDNINMEIEHLKWLIQNKILKRKNKQHSKSYDN